MPNNELLALVDYKDAKNNKQQQPSPAPVAPPSTGALSAGDAFARALRGAENSQGSFEH